MSMAERRHSEESKRKISRALTGRKMPEKIKRKISSSLRKKWDLIREIEAANAAAEAANAA